MFTENQPWAIFLTKCLVFPVLVIFNQRHAVVAGDDGCVMACIAKDE